VLGADVSRAFFTDEETAIYTALARRDAATDPALSEAERARRLAELDASQPASVRAARAAALAPLAQIERERALRAAGASDADIAAARTRALGADAAARLAEMDRTRAAWDARLARFRAERAALLAAPGLDDDTRQQKVTELFERSFTPPERMRVEALDRLADRAARN
jgi:lipase chaperone LimK